MTKHRDDCDRWISVGERLPESSHLVFAHDKDDGLVTAIYHEHDSGHDDNWHIQPFKGTWDKCACSITHWLPIPDLPKPTKSNKCVCRDCRWWDARCREGGDGMCFMPHLPLKSQKWSDSCCYFEKRVDKGPVSIRGCKNCRYWYDADGCHTDYRYCHSQDYRTQRNPAVCAVETHQDHSCGWWEAIGEHNCGDCRHWEYPLISTRGICHSRDKLITSRNAHRGRVYSDRYYCCGRWDKIKEVEKCECGKDTDCSRPFGIVKGHYRLSFHCEEYRRYFKFCGLNEYAIRRLAKWLNTCWDSRR